MGIGLKLFLTLFFTNIIMGSSSLLDNFDSAFQNMITSEFSCMESLTSLHQLLVGCNISTPFKSSEIAFMFISEESVNQISDSLGIPSIDHNDIVNMLSFFNHIRNNIEFKVQCMASLPSWLTKSSSSSSSSSQQCVVPVKVVSGKRKSLGSTNPNSLVRKYQAKRKDSKHATVLKLKNLVSSLPVDSVPYSFHNVSHRYQLVDVISKSFDNHSVGSIKGRIAFWDFYIECAENLNFDPFAPSTPNILATWEVKTKSSKMSAKAFKGNIQWVIDTLGIPITFNKVIKRSIKNSQKSFAPKRGQAPTPSFSQIAHLEKLCMPEYGNPVVNLFASVWLLCAWASLRFVDVQRLVIKTWELESKVMSGLILGQKDAENGDLSAPLEFIVPLFGFTNPNWFLPLMSIPKKGFLLPSLSASIKTPNVEINWDTELHPSKVATILADLMALQADPGHPLNSPVLKGHSFRHWLPTAALVVRMKPEFSNLLGRWAPPAAARSDMSAISRLYASSGSRLRATLQSILGIHWCIILAKMEFGIHITLDHLSPKHLEIDSVASMLKRAQNLNEGQCHDTPPSPPSSSASEVIEGPPPLDPAYSICKGPLVRPAPRLSLRRLSLRQ
jgi:hypothetical protein